MKPTPFDPERHQSNPHARTHSCPVSFSGVISMHQARIPDYQNQWRQAKTKKEKVAILVRWAKATGMLNEAPDIFHEFEEMLDKAA